MPRVDPAASSSAVLLAHNLPLSYLPYLFYLGEGKEGAQLFGLPSPYTWSIWSPSKGGFWPGANSTTRVKLRFAFRYAVFHLNLFINADCGALCIFRGNTLVHYSGFTPRYWRFRFLKDEDLQIGDTWTHPSERGPGLAFFAVSQILALKHKTGRRFWYVVEKTNLPSIRVIEKASFTVVGQGSFVEPLGIKLFGTYRIGSQGPLASARA